jgi:hypothetical protein
LPKPVLLKKMRWGMIAAKRALGRQGQAAPIEPLSVTWEWAPSSPRAICRRYNSAAFGRVASTFALSLTLAAGPLQVPGVCIRRDQWPACSSSGVISGSPAANRPWPAVAVSILWAKCICTDHQNHRNHRAAALSTDCEGRCSRSGSCKLIEAAAGLPPPLTETRICGWYRGSAHPQLSQSVSALSGREH